MTKEEWLEIRKQEIIPIKIFHDYYEECGGTLDLLEFNEIFPRIMQGSYLGGKFVSYATAIKRLYNYFDKKFKV